MSGPKRCEADARPLDEVPASALSERAVQRAFARIAALNCRDTVRRDCIPFDYRAWGCEVRAHVVCRRLAAMRIVAGKVWLFDRPVGEPRPRGARQFVWEWHVAAFVRASSRRGRAAVRIIDPSFHRRAVTLRALLRRFQADPRKVLFTTADCLQLGADGRGAPDRRSPRFGRHSDTLLAQLRLEAHEQ